MLQKRYKKQMEKVVRKAANRGANLAWPVGLCTETKQLRKVGLMGITSNLD